ncbi:hypothetical protein BGZ70_003797 [Mortierella alpina]|uniref:FAD-binding PCMH-type domain-containing protein n=1 Tax=Mortierella alpina TaxID=64518 RepID=A0A9P6JCN1_MORAP|nr:hypothetical protein BGZ70_003797 [Mortierella alpina]
MHIPSPSTAVLLLLLISSSSLSPLAQATPLQDSLALDASPTSQLLVCLEPLGAKVLTSNDAKYDEERYVFDRRHSYLPQVIVMASSVSDVHTAVKCATAARVAVAPRSGGHSYEGYSLGGQDGALVIDLGGLTSVVVENGVAKVGAGIRLGQLYLELFYQGGYTLNAGTCPSVGIGGLALGGGFGLLGPKYGLLIDRIIEMQMVDAQGQLLTISATSNADLFFALRGAGGGSFGVVTEFTLLPIKPSPVVTSFSYNWKPEEYSPVLTFFAAFQSLCSDEIGIKMNAGPNGLRMSGLFEGTPDDQMRAMAPFFAQVPKPNQTDVREGRYIDAQLRLASIPNDPKDIEALLLKVAPRTRKGKSLLYPKALQASTIALLVPEDATAFIHRSAHTVIEFMVDWTRDPNTNPEQGCEACLEWMNTMYTEFLDDFKVNYGPVRGYQNYIDLEIPSWQDAYYGSALPRLKQIKRAVDPENTFRFPQSIPLQ